ncbi:MAG: hypothetical protein K9J29_02690 [Bacteroidia bacterium]|nr:hypothetical protein [Bacteroidia bacterium]
MESPPGWVQRGERGSRSRNVIMARKIPSSRGSRGRRPRRFTAVEVELD